VCLLLGAGQTYNEHASGGTTVGATIRERITGTASVANIANAATAKDGSALSTGGAAGNVKRAAEVTLNQLLSSLFERAKDIMNETQLSPERSNGESSILLVAERTWKDLCTLVRKSSTSQLEPKMKLNGPFGVASKEGLSPSSTTCFALVDMILKQICKDMFRVCFNFYGSSNEGASPQTDAANPGVKFATQIIGQALQLGQSLLGSQYCYHVTKVTLESSLKEDPNSSSSGGADLMDFCMFYYTTALASTILTHYLSSTSLAFYGNFDAAETSAESGSSDGNNLTTMSKMALDIMKQLVSFVTEATESYHKSDDFEVSRLAFYTYHRSTRSCS
jgi:hypothetical protein